MKMLYGLLTALVVIEAICLFGGALLYIGRWVPVVLEYPGWLMLGGFVAMIPTAVGISVIEQRLRG